MKKLLLLMITFLLFNNSFAQSVKEVLIEEKDKNGNVTATSKKTISKSPKQYKVIETEHVEEVVDKDGNKTTKKIIEREKVSLKNNNVDSDAWYDYSENYFSIGVIMSGSDTYSGNFVTNKENNDISGFSFSISKRYGSYFKGNKDSWYIEPNIDIQLINTNEHKLYTVGTLTRSVERDGFIPTINISAGYIIDDKFDLYTGFGFGSEDVTYKNTYPTSYNNTNYKTSEMVYNSYMGIRYNVKKDTWVELSYLSQEFKEPDRYGTTYTSGNDNENKSNRNLVRVSFVKRF